MGTEGATASRPLQARSIRRLVSLGASLALAGSTLVGSAGAVLASPGWTTLSMTATDVWYGESFRIDATTPSDTREYCAIVYDGEIQLLTTWAELNDSFGYLNADVAAEGWTWSPASGTRTISIQCYDWISDGTSSPPVADDAYVSGVEFTIHAATYSASSGDTFTPASAAPAVDITSVPSELFQPAYTDSSYGPDSDGTSTAGVGQDYSVDVTITEANGADDVTGATLCLYQIGNADQCSSSNPDPRYALVLTWTRPVDGTLGSGGNDGFAKVGENNARLNGHVMDRQSSWLDQVCSDGSCVSDRFHTDLRFWFDVSDAMHAGSGWYAKVTAVNSAEQTGSDEMLTEGVGYFAWVTTARTPLDYGSLDAGDASEKTGALGTFVANASSVIYLQASDFTYSGDRGTASVTLDPADGPDAGTVALDCAATDTFMWGNAVRVGYTPVALVGDLFSLGTGEAGDSTLVNSCRLAYGGGAAISKVEYSATVWVGIGSANSSTPTAGRYPGQDPTYYVIAP